MSDARVPDEQTTLLDEYVEHRAPVKVALLGLVALVFVGELALTMRASVSRVELLATGLFAIHPVGAWTLSPLLHRDVVHVAASIGGLLLVGVPLEHHWSSKRYTVFLVIAGYGSIVSGAAVLSLFSDQQVAFYGTSGIVYALAGFGFTHLVRQHEDRQRIEMVLLAIGVVAFLEVVIDLLTGPYLTPHWFNGGHLAGFGIGALSGAGRWSGCAE